MSYAAGRRAEYRVMLELRRRGYDPVIRSAGSHGPVDLIGVRESHLLFVQVKYGARRPSPGEYLAFTRLRVPLNVHRQVWYLRPRKGIEVVWPER